MLGAAVLGQEDYADAETLLLAGYQGMKQREEKEPAQVKKTCLPAALERLINLYDATGKAEDAARRRNELEALNALYRETTPAKP
jgi:hypothetical protein